MVHLVSSWFLQISCGAPLHWAPHVVCESTHPPLGASAQVMGVPVQAFIVTSHGPLAAA